MLKTLNTHKVGIRSPDVTLPASQVFGGTHPISKTIHRVERIMRSMNFIREDGPVIESGLYSFTALNITEGHPAMESHDTFQLKSGKILRTQCSSVAARVFESRKHQAPLSFFVVGRAYRRDDDPTHLPAFYQIDAWAVGKGVTVAHLKGCIEYFLKAFFYPKKVEVRIRSSYFPFTLPSLEIDIKFNDSKWLEVMGAGMISKNILERSGYGDCTGFAFGGGIERLAMIKYGVKNISQFTQNRADFLINFEKASR